MDEGHTLWYTERLLPYSFDDVSGMKIRSQRVQRLPSDCHKDFFFQSAFSNSSLSVWKHFTKQWHCCHQRFAFPPLQVALVPLSIIVDKVRECHVKWWTLFCWRIMLSFLPTQSHESPPTAKENCYGFGWRWCRTVQNLCITFFILIYWQF